MARSASPKKPVKKVAKKSAKKSASTTAAKKKSAKPAAKSAKAKAKPKKRVAGEEEVTVDRRHAERRDEENAGAPAAPAPKKLERREKVNRRRQIDPTTCERDYTDAEVEFMNALDEYKRKSGRMFPTCSEVLEVIRDIGYVQLTPAEKAARDTQAVEADPAAEQDAQAEAEVDDALELSDEIRLESEEDAGV